MEIIFSTLSDPAAWISNIVFGLSATLIWKTFPYLKNILVKLFRSHRLKRLRKIRIARTNYAAVNFAIGKAVIMQAVFLILCFLYLLAITLSAPYREIFQFSFVAGLFLASPILIFELIWLSYDSYAEILVKESAKISRSRRISKII